MRLMRNVLQTFDFDRHRRIDQYGPITTQTGVVEPEYL